jgi:hypothetical protein
MQFKFNGGVSFTTMAFTPPAVTGSLRNSDPGPLLLVTDPGANAVHVVDVVGRVHVGYLAPPGSIPGPRGVAASRTSPLVAVSAERMWVKGSHGVRVYRGSGAEWVEVRVIEPPGLAMPRGLRFSGDGSALCIAECHHNRVSVVRAEDGSLVRHAGTGGSPSDVEEVEGGWLVASNFSTHAAIVLVGGREGGEGPSIRGWRALVPTQPGASGGPHSIDEGMFRGPIGLALVPGVKLALRDCGRGGRLQVFAIPPHLVRMPLSPLRLAWIVAVVRGVLVVRGTPSRGQW